MYSLKQKNRRKRTIILIGVSILVISLLSGAWYVQKTYTENLRPISNDTKITVVTIESGSSVHDVALLLEQRGLIRKSWAFEWYVRSKNVRDKLQAGSYGFMPSMSVEEIIAVIIDGKVATNLFTILPAQRLDQIQDAFVKEFTKTGFTEAQVQAAFDATAYATHPALTDKPTAASLEGYIYPESFEKTATTTPQTIIKSSLDEMASALSPEVRAGITKQGLTVHEGVVLASIIENEVSNAEDKKKVAQVFLKRLKMKMKLQSDPTAFYGSLIVGQEKSLTFDSPFNTYIIPALPLGPISNVSLSSLQAIGNPASTDYLYFVAGDDGTTHFAKTLKEHESNIDLYCKELCGN